MTRDDLVQPYYFNYFISTLQRRSYREMWTYRYKYIYMDKVMNILLNDSPISTSNSPPSVHTHSISLFPFLNLNYCSTYFILSYPGLLSELHNCYYSY